MCSNAYACQCVIRKQYNIINDCCSKKNSHECETYIARYGNIHCTVQSGSNIFSLI